MPAFGPGKEVDDMLLATPVLTPITAVQVVAKWNLALVTAVEALFAMWVMALVTAVEDGVVMWVMTLITAAEDGVVMWVMTLITVAEDGVAMWVMTLITVAEDGVSMSTLAQMVTAAEEGVTWVLSAMLLMKALVPMPGLAAGIAVEEGVALRASCTRPGAL